MSEEQQIRQAAYLGSLDANTELIETRKLLEAKEAEIKELVGALNHGLCKWSRYHVSGCSKDYEYGIECNCGLEAYREIVINLLAKHKGDGGE